ncbi:hypothetical protein EIN_218000 [Entamoeba invadens IP1]|uniref:Uncharacterized protein n=1 Tax=Entamoeba invadens IP1 TaxID=370355 RepID=L7FQT5_ENTIV|nr:hypothetical protein EIN_218000 [Entamoeba invadens IP1]ELP95335.1 hypothetical protein EIN_218000 [Entamoeba invadens IP1]|eukprot:XP_004262106.1 hypothetical protein EIN_218000 [Entamoeba invadens IP1]
MSDFVSNDSSVPFENDISCSCNQPTIAVHNDPTTITDIPEVHGPQIEIGADDIEDANEEQQNYSNDTKPHNLILHFFYNIFITLKFLWKYFCNGLCDSLIHCNCICDFFECAWCDAVECCACFWGCKCCDYDYCDEACTCPFYTKYCCVPCRLLLCCDTKHTCCEKCCNGKTGWDYICQGCGKTCDCFCYVCECVCKPILKLFEIIGNLICCTYCTCCSCDKKCDEVVGCMTCGCCGNVRKYRDCYVYVWDCGYCKEKCCYTCNFFCGGEMCVCTPCYIMCCQWLNCDCHTWNDKNVKCCDEDCREQCCYVCKCDCSRQCCEYNVRLIRDDE